MGSNVKDPIQGFWDKLMTILLSLSLAHERRASSDELMFELTAADILERIWVEEFVLDTGWLK